MPRSPRDPQPPGPAVRYLTLASARALECNGCGDCCDSRRTDGYWTWASLPADGYADRCDGEPLIIPLALVDGSWVERTHLDSDLGELSGTRFRCAAFVETPPTEMLPGGGGSCARHDSWRPPACGEFPVGGEGLEAELREHGEVVLSTDAFPRCTWYRMTIVGEGDPRTSA